MSRRMHIMLDSDTLGLLAAHSRTGTGGARLREKPHESRVQSLCRIMRVRIM